MKRRFFRDSSRLARLGLYCVSTMSDDESVITQAYRALKRRGNKMWTETAISFNPFSGSPDHLRHQEQNSPESEHSENRSTNSNRAGVRSSGQSSLMSPPPQRGSLNRARSGVRSSGQSSLMSPPPSLNRARSSRGSLGRFRLRSSPLHPPGIKLFGSRRRHQNHDNDKKENNDTVSDKESRYIPRIISERITLLETTINKMQYKIENLCRSHRRLERSNVELRYCINAWQNKDSPSPSTGNISDRSLDHLSDLKISFGSSTDGEGEGERRRERRIVDSSEDDGEDDINNNEDDEVDDINNREREEEEEEKEKWFFCSFNGPNKGLGEAVVDSINDGDTWNSHKMRRLYNQVNNFPLSKTTYTSDERKTKENTTRSCTRTIQKAYQNQISNNTNFFFLGQAYRFGCFPGKFFPKKDLQKAKEYYTEAVRTATEDKNGTMKNKAQKALQDCVDEIEEGGW